LLNGEGAGRSVARRGDAPRSGKTLILRRIVAPSLDKTCVRPNTINIRDTGERAS